MLINAAGHATARQVAGGQPGIGRERAAQLARRELARSIYKPSLLSRLGHDILDWLSSLTSHGVGGSPGWLGILAGIIAVAAVLAIALALTRSARDNRRRSAPAVFAGPQLSAGEHRKAADTHATAGDYGGAIIERVRAIAAELESRQILPPRPGRTAMELAGEAGRAIPAEASGLRSAARLFDDVRYGGRSGDEPGYQQVRDLDLRILAIPIRTEAAAGTASGQAW